jgi:ribosomal protein S26
MLGKLFDAVFGCTHSRYSFPLTIARSALRNSAAAVTGTYVACLDCGKELPYDWKAMKVVRSASEAKVSMSALATKEAA